ncbi:MAG: hypothetical protein AAF657_37225 [Acidobacteriota bacterium]
MQPYSPSPRHAPRWLLSCMILVVGVLLCANRAVHAQVVGYTVDNDGLNEIDLGSGQLTAIGDLTGFAVAALDFDPAGTLYGIDVAGGQLVTIDTENAAVTIVGSLGIDLGRFPSPDITFDACGALWLTDGSIFSNNSSTLYAVDPVSGAAQRVGNMGRTVFSLAAFGDRILGLAKVPPPILGQEMVDVDPLTAEISSPRTLEPRAVVAPWIDFDRTGVLWGFNSGLLITPPEPALTWVLEPEAGGLRRVAEAGFFTHFTGFAVDRPQGVCAAGACRPGARRHCLLDRRFLAEVEWQDFSGNSGSGRTLRGASDQSGLFWFFDPLNWELQVKVLDGCAINGHFWVFSAATTNVGYLLRVTDTETGEVREYSNTLGETAATVVDTTAFSTCSQG